MATRRISFYGQSVRIPGAYSHVDAEALTPSILGAFSRIGVVGSATGGIPQEIRVYDRASAAENDYKSGDLLDAMKLMWNPAPQGTGASEVLACRVDPATQSDSILLDTDGKNVIQLTSRNYGRFTQNIKYSITDNVDGYGKKIEIVDAGDQASSPEQSFNGLGTAFKLTRTDAGGALTYDVEIINLLDATYVIDEFVDDGGPGPYHILLDVGLGDISDRFIPNVQITVDGSGSGNDGTKTITASTFDGTRTKLTISTPLTAEVPAPGVATGAISETHTMKVYVNGSTTPEIELDLENSIYGSAYKIVEYLNNNFSGIYEARIVGDNLISRSLDSRNLDTDLQTGIAVNVDYNATAHVQLVADWINTNSALVTATVLTDAWIYELENVVEQALSGGATGAATTADWEDAISLFEAEDVQLMMVVTDDLSIQLMLKSHIAYMSGQGRSERRGYYGHPLGSSIEDVKDIALALSSSRGMLLSPGIAFSTDPDTGDPELKSSVFAAAMACGMVAGFPPQEPLTNKQLGIIDIEKSYLESEILELLDSGVAPIKHDRVRRLFKIVQGQTTWLSDENTLYKEDSVGRIADFISLNVRRNLEDKFVGSAAESGSAEDMRVEVTDMLRQMLKNGLITNYGDVSVRIEDTIAYVEYEVAPSSPINFILITTRFVPSRLVA